MTLDYLLNEKVDDIPTHNKLYHRTNLNALIDILMTKKLKGFKYISNVETKLKGHLDPYLQIKYPEIATARKSTITTLNKTHRDEHLSLGAGAIEFELFKDRIRTLRSVNIEPIDEYRAREGEERIILKKVNFIPTVPTYMKINIVPRNLTKDFIHNIFDEVNDDNHVAYLRLKLLEKLIKENINLFNRDHNFRYFLAWLDDAMEKYKKRYEKEAENEK